MILYEYAKNCKTKFHKQTHFNHILNIHGKYSDIYYNYIGNKK